MSISLNHLLLSDAPPTQRKPSWLKMKMPGGEGYSKLLKLVNEQRLHTVCQSAKCPNMGECWAAGTATLMILGDVCTRTCGFCHIATGRPPTLDLDEPRRVGDAVATMKLEARRHHQRQSRRAARWRRGSLGRDDPPDSPAIARHERRSAHPRFLRRLGCAATRARRSPRFSITTSKPSRGSTTRVRPQAKYHRSLKLLQIAKDQGLVSKTGMMLGFGETEHEIDAVLDDLVAIGCEILTLGQYLQPTLKHLPVDRWVHPDEFADVEDSRRTRGLRHVESGPLVRSSYHAEKQVIAHAAT